MSQEAVSSFNAKCQKHQIHGTITDEPSAFLVDLGVACISKSDPTWPDQ